MGDGDQKTATMMSIVILYTILARASDATSILAYNCESENILITRVAAGYVAECKREPNKIMKRHIEIQIIQTKKVESIEVFHCHIEKLAIIHHCGHLSHSSIVQGGLSSTMIELSASECMQIQREKYFRYKGNTLNNIKPNSTQDFAITEAGEVQADGTCRGTNINQNGIYYKDAVMITNLKITMENYVTTMDTITRRIAFDDGTSCYATAGSCFTAKKGTSVWQYSLNKACSKTSRDVLYEGKAIVTSTEKITESELHKGEIIIVENQQKLITLEITGATHLCFQIVYTTESDRIMVVTKNPVYGYYFEKNHQIIPQNIDLPLYMNMKIYYLAAEVKENLEELYNEIKYVSCTNKREAMLTKLRIARQNEITYSHLLTEEKGYMTVQQGNCLLSIKCEPVIVEIRETNNCYKNLPVVFNNKTMFMEPNGRTLTKTPSQIPCTRIASALFEIEDGVWISMSPHFSYAKPPKILEPQTDNINMDFGDVKRYLLAGIYSQEQLESFNDYIRHPMKIKQAREYITTKMVDNTRQNQEANFKFTNLLSTEEIKKIKNDFLTDVEKKILRFGSIMGATTGIILLIQVARYIISTVVNFKFLKSTLGCGTHLIAATFTSITNLLVRNNVARSDEKQQAAQEKKIMLYPTVETEMQEEDSGTA